MIRGSANQSVIATALSVLLLVMTVGTLGHRCDHGSSPPVTGHDHACHGHDLDDDRPTRLPHDDEPCSLCVLALSSVLAEAPAPVDFLEHPTPDATVATPESIVLESASAAPQGARAPPVLRFIAS